MSRSSRRHRQLSLLALLAVTSLVGLHLTTLTDTPVTRTAGATAAPRAYYVGCHGSDVRTGTTPERAWRTLARASRAVIAPGGSLRLQRGCTWDGQRIELHWAGTAARPIRVGSFGDTRLPRPALRNGSHENVLVTGSHLVISSLSVSHDVASRTTCGQPIGDYVGFEFTRGAHDNTLRKSRASGEMAGARLESSSSRTRLVHNEFVGNDVVQSMQPGHELGAWGVLVDAPENEVAWNIFRANRSVCAMSNGRYASNSVELYGASRNRIHHNRSFGDRVFSELGSSSSRTSSRNTYGYNLFVSRVPSSRFITTRGPLDTSFGPVIRTTLLHNTSYQTGDDSQGVVCSKGCGPDILQMRANIVWAETKVIYADGPVRPSSNIIWNSRGRPFVQMERRADDGSLVHFLLGADNLTRDPRFTGASTGDFLPAADSPAVDRDPLPPHYRWDLRRTSLGRDGRSDLGALERPRG